ncbi:MAG: tRNA (guanosine(37)-N1)-methyltransferase TrmD [Deltaproteobacteria bacterium]|nr:tRNA (guanosine(37)-N1)-methyltransferase TrmD [Deltaproteobacteria bacterium]
MRFHVLTVFPEIFDSFLDASLLGKAIKAGRVEVRLVQVRDFTKSRHRTTDDAPYGGGAGMVMLVEPIVRALESLPGEARPRVLLSPRGKPFSQGDARRWAVGNELALVCGRYEGVDERVRGYVDEEVSLGDFVLAGGEVAAMAIVEAVCRLVPEVLGNEASAVEESFGAEALLEFPQYSRPSAFRGARVPDVLLSGDHERIRRWRRRSSLELTRRLRPDLFESVALTDEDRALLAESDDAAKSPKGDDAAKSPKGDQAR